MTTLIGQTDQLFPLGREHFLLGDLAWVTDTFNITLQDATDEAPDTTDEFKGDIIAGSYIDATTESNNEIGSRATLDTGTADGADVTMDLVTGDECEVLIIYREVGGSQATPATDELVVFIEDALGLPIVPNGGDITVQWDAGTDRIFTL